MDFSSSCSPYSPKIFTVPYIILHENSVLVVMYDNTPVMTYSSMICYHIASLCHDIHRNPLKCCNQHVTMYEMLGILHHMCVAQNEHLKLVGPVLYMVILLQMFSDSPTENIR